MLHKHRFTGIMRFTAYNIESTSRKLIVHRITQIRDLEAVYCDIIHYVLILQFGNKDFLNI